MPKLGQILYTTAPESYDGFGSRTARVVAVVKGGKLIRRVMVAAEHAEWQTMRYHSGGIYLVADEAEFQKLVAYGIAERVATRGRFGFDCMPSHEGFSYGDFWNGWSKPLFARSAIEAMRADGTLLQDDFRGRFEDDGTLVLTSHDHEDRVAPSLHRVLDQPEGFVVQSRNLYDLGDLGLAWTSDE